MENSVQIASCIAPVLPEVFQIQHNCDSPFMELTLYNKCVSGFMLFLTTLELPINSPRVSLKVLWCCLHKNPHQLGTTEITVQHIDHYCLSLVLPKCVCSQLLSHLKHAM